MVVHTYSSLPHARTLQVFESTGGIWSVDQVEDALKKKFSTKEAGTCQFCCAGLGGKEKEYTV